MKFYGRIHTADEAKNPEFAKHYSAWRWAVEIKGFDVWVTREARVNDTNTWRQGYGYYNVHIRRKISDWKLAREHAYYDGPHDHLAIGPLYVNWQGDWCDKCYAGE